MFSLNLTENFKQKFERLAKNNAVLRKKTEKTLLLLSRNPLYNSLKTHKVETKKIGVKFSSVVSGDIRIIWDYGKFGVFILDILDIGGHSGKNKIYK